MAKEYAKHFYKSKEWKKCREAYYISQHGICERCGKPGEIVHHKIYITPGNINNPEVTLNFDNLELLCQDCHNKEHHSSNVTAEGLMFDGDGNLVREHQNTPPGSMNTFCRPRPNCGHSKTSERFHT